MSESDRGVQEVALAIHAILCTLHGVAALYHARRRRWVNAGLHTAGVLLDAWAMGEHWREWRRR
jgi:hypothetical protein